MRRTAVLLSTVGLTIFSFAAPSFASDAYPPQEPTTTVQQLPPPPTTTPPTTYCPPCPTGSGQYGSGHSGGACNPNGSGSGSGSGGSSSYNCPTSLPTTGSDTSSSLQIAAVALASGIGLVGVAGVRRRKPARVPAA